MKSIAFLAVLVLASLAGCNRGGGGASSDVERLERQKYLEKNIEFHLREVLKGRPVSVGEIEESEFPGFDKGTFNAGGGEIPFLVSKDDQHVLVLAVDPFTNLSEEEMDAAIKAELREATSADEERHAALKAASSGVPVRGNPNAAISIVEFSDFQCPYCRRGFDTVEQILDRYGDEIRFVYMHYPLPTHPWARPSAVVAACAAQQSDDAFWTLHDYYFRNQRQVKVENVVEKSRDVLRRSGIDLAAWEACTSDTSSDAHRAAVATVDSQQQLGRQAGVSGTPGFFVNGKFISGAQPIEVFEKAIEEAKARL